MEANNTWFSGKPQRAADVRREVHGDFASTSRDNQTRTTRQSWQTCCDEPEDWRPLGVEYESRCLALRTEYALAQHPMVLLDDGSMRAPSISQMAQTLAADGVHDFWPMPRYERLDYLHGAYSDVAWTIKCRGNGVIPEHARVATPRVIGSAPIGTEGWYYTISGTDRAGMRVFRAKSFDAAVAGTRNGNKRVLCGPFAAREIAERVGWNCDPAMRTPWIETEEWSAGGFSTRILGPILPG